MCGEAVEPQAFTLRSVQCDGQDTLCRAMVVADRSMVNRRNSIAVSWCFANGMAWTPLAGQRGVQQWVSSQLGARSELSGLSMMGIPCCCSCGVYAPDASVLRGLAAV